MHTLVVQMNVVFIKTASAIYSFWHVMQTFTELLQCRDRLSLKSSVWQ